MKKINTFGAEVEKPVTNLKTGKSYPVSQSFFKNLKKAADTRKIKSHYHFSDLKPETILGTVSDDLGEQGLDNGFNLLETSLPYQKSLTNLNKRMLIDLKITQEALEKENASVINLSIHPLGKRDMKTYKKFVAPKTVYKFLWLRDWDHSAGIDARAQNSPGTGVNASQAAEAVSAILGTGAATVALFGNSPFEEGERSEFKESRLTMWDRMMGNSKSKADLTTAHFPKSKFNNLAQYFNWMFGKNTQIYFVLARGNSYRDYKSVGDKILLPKEKLSILEYLAKKEVACDWFKETGKKNPKIESVTPNISDMEVLQYCQFAGARIRFKLKNQDNFPLKEFLKACQKNSQKVEEILDKFSEYFYIEGRDPGANFPDREILAAGKDIAKSVVISPSALQTGLIKNLTKVTKYLDKFEWSTLGKLRTAAIKEGLKGKVGNITVEKFTKDILNLAEESLDENEKWMLNYPKWVLRTKENGADRAIKFVKNYKGNLNKALVELVKSRKIIL